jgi:hypothetical protein
LKINVNNFDYIVYVDASGDDGMKFEKCSSLCFTTACFISAVSDISQNTFILNKIKEMCGRKITDELKHSRLRRHRAYSGALKELENLKGMVAIHNSFKQEIVNNENLTAFTHTFPIELILKLEEFSGKNILICIDRMKQTDMNVVEQILGLKNHESNIKIIFRDSKDINFELIQIADILSGLFRCFFEDTITDADFKSFIKICSICYMSIKANKLKRSCDIIKYKAIRNRLMSKVQNVRHLLIKGESGIILRGISMFPAKAFTRYYFLECAKK